VRVANVLSHPIPVNIGHLDVCYDLIKGPGIKDSDAFVTSCRDLGMVTKPGQNLLKHVTNALFVIDD